MSMALKNLMDKNHQEAMERISEIERRLSRIEEDRKLEMDMLIETKQQEKKNDKWTNQRSPQSSR
jgi:hypothetical protein